MYFFMILVLRLLKEKLVCDIRIWCHSFNLGKNKINYTMMI